MWRASNKSTEHYMSGFNMKAFQPVDGVFEVDPVCEMKVDPQNPPFKILYQGKSYYFCSEVCKHLFERMPEKYVKTDVA
jgi:YHS domain-containing protein